MTEIPGQPHRPGDPAQPADAGAPQAFGSPPEEPRRRTGKRILVSVIGLVVAGAAAFGIRAVIGSVVDEVSGDLSTAEVGDCIDQQADINDTTVVDCSSEEAAMRVIGINTDWSETDFDAASLDEVCEGYTVPPGGGAIWYGSESSDGSGTGDVYCVEPLG